MHKLPMYTLTGPDINHDIEHTQQFLHRRQSTQLNKPVAVSVKISIDAAHMPWHEPSQDWRAAPGVQKITSDRFCPYTIYSTKCTALRHYCRSAHTGAEPLDKISAHGTLYCPHPEHTQSAQTYCFSTSVLGSAVRTIEHHAHRHLIL